MNKRVTRVSIRNNSNHPLTGVVLGGIDSSGKFKVLEYVGSLESKSARSSVELDNTDFSPFNSVVIRCDQKVGGILYLRDTEDPKSK